MTRFEREISGQLGTFWVKNAEKEVKLAVKQADAEALVEADGAIRWKNSGAYLMDDFCEKLEYAGYPFSRAATKAKRKEQEERELAAYLAAPHEISAEDRAEMEAAFGSGTAVVDVLTGEKVL